MTSTGSRPRERRTPSIPPGPSELDAAGYRDTDGDGVREDKAGNPIELRLYARSQSATDQRVAKLIAGWLEAVGVQIDLQVIDEGAMSDKIYNYKGDTFAPDYDMFLWYWYSDPDPNFILSVLTEAQIGAWSDTQWSDPEYDPLYASSRRPSTRSAQGARLEDAADRLRPEPVHHADVPGVARGLRRHAVDRVGQDAVRGRPVIYTQYNIDSYLFAEPSRRPRRRRTEAAALRASSSPWSSRSGSSPSSPRVVVRRRRRAVEE